MHNLLHLYEDLNHFQRSLKDISCFPFENNLQRLKRFARSAKNPLTQICKRQSEFQKSSLKPADKCTKISTKKKDGCFLLHDHSVAFIQEKRSVGKFVCNVIKPTKQHG